jgi:hypothetical protein
MTFHLTAVIENHALMVEFTLRNPFDVDVYVSQFEPTRTWPPERRGYVYVHREDRLLFLFFGTVPNPPRVCLAQEIKFYAERLGPGETLSRSITLRLPVAENGKLIEADPAAPHEVVNVDRVRCTVCYTAKQRGPAVTLAVLAGCRALESEQRISVAADAGRGDDDVVDPDARAATLNVHGAQE